MSEILSTRPFGEVAEFRNGLNYPASSRRSGNLAVVGVGDFQENERLTDYSGLERIQPPENFDDGSLLRSGDLVFVRSNGNKALIGRCMKLEDVVGPVTHSGFTIRARMTTDEIDPEWIAQYFAVGLAKREIARRGGGTNISNLSQKILGDLPIPIPSSALHKKFLILADQFSQTRCSLESLAKTKRKFKRGLQQALLTGGTRFPEFKAESWIDVNLGDVFEERVERNRPELPLLSVTNDRGIIPRDQLEKRDTSNPDKSKYKRVAVGDIAYNTMRMWQGVSALSSLEGIVSPAYTVVVPTDRIDGTFAKHLFKFAPIVNLFYRFSQGLVDDTRNLKFDRFSKIKVSIPRSVEEQMRIGAVLDACDTELELIAAERKQFELFKCGLISRLLSGELEVTKG
jgi:type I restriction enzyme S subunit